MRDGLARRVAVAVAAALLAAGTVVAIAGSLRPPAADAAPGLGAMAPRAVTADVPGVPVRVRPPVDRDATERSLRLTQPLIGALLALLLGLAASLGFGRVDLRHRRRTGLAFRRAVAPRAPPSSPLAA